MLFLCKWRLGQLVCRLGHGTDGMLTWTGWEVCKCVPRGVERLSSTLVLPDISTANVPSLKRPKSAAVNLNELNVHRPILQKNTE